MTAPSPVTLRIRNLDYDTYPCVFHHNGGDRNCRYGLALKQQFFDLIGEPGTSFSFSKNGRLADLQLYRRPTAQLPLRPVPRLTIVSFTSFPYLGSAELSLNHLGVPIDVIRGRGRWRNIDKLAFFEQYLGSVDTDYVLYMDSHDTFVTSDIFGIVGAFEKMDCRVLFQADSNDWPTLEELGHWYDSVADGEIFRYLCSGIFIGETPFVKRMIGRALETEPILPADDQGVYKKVFRELHPEVRLDCHSQLFQTLADYHHSKRNMFTPVDLNLQLESKIALEALPNPSKLTAQKLVRGLPRRVSTSLRSALTRGK